LVLLAAVVATLPAFLSAGSDASLSTVAFVTGLYFAKRFPMDFRIDMDFTSKENFGDGVEGGVKYNLTKTPL
jgi:hypothetical protein